jgi:hypothetical protein
MNTQTSNETLSNVWNTLLKIEKALVEKDAVAFELLLSDDFIGAIPTGESFTKAAYIHHHCKTGIGVIALTGSDIDTSVVRFYNNTAVVNRRVHAQFKLPVGNVIAYDVQRIEVFVKRENEWQMVSGQGTIVNLLNQARQSN